MDGWVVNIEDTGLHPGYLDSMFYDDYEEEEIMGNITRVYPYFPPTEEPSVYTLCVTVALITCLTVGICGNVSQLVLQIYAHRLSIRGSPTQIYLALLFTIHFFVSASLPSVILEKLVNIWLFGTTTCRSHYLFVTIGRTLAAWIIVFLFFQQCLRQGIYPRLAAHQKRIFSGSLCYLLLFLGLLIVPNLVFVDLAEEKKDEFRGEDYVMRIRTFRCVVRIPNQLDLASNLIRFMTEYGTPLILIIFLNAQAMRWKTSLAPAAAFHRKNSHILLVIASFHFVSYIPYWITFIPMTADERWGFTLPDVLTTFLADVAQLLPPLSAASIWIPMSWLSTTLDTVTRGYDLDTTPDTRRSARVSL